MRIIGMQWGGKRVWGVLGWVVLISVSASTGALADARSFQKSVDSWVLQSQGAHKACDAYRAQLAKVDQRGKPSFKNRAWALATLAVLNRYPGAPQAAAQVYDSALKALPPGVNWTWFTKAYGNVQGACGVIESSDAMNRLINTTRIIRFTAADRTKIRASVTSFISKNTRQPGTLITVLLPMSLLDNAVNARLLAMDAKSLAEFRALRREGEKARTELMNRVANRKNPSDQERSSYMIYELRTANTLRTKLVPLLNRIK